MEEIIQFSKIERDLELYSFSGALDGNFAIKCLKAPRKKSLEKELDEFATKTSVGRNFLDSNYAYEFIGDSHLIRAIHVPIFMYGGIFEMMSFSKELLLDCPEDYFGEDASKIYYGSANIPTKESCEDVKGMILYWISRAQEIIPK